MFTGPPPTTYAVVDAAMLSSDQVEDAIEELSDRDEVMDDDEDGVDVDSVDDKDVNVEDPLLEEVDKRVLVLVELKPPFVNVNEA